MKIVLSVAVLAACVLTACSSVVVGPSLDRTVDASASETSVTESTGAVVAPSASIAGSGSTIAVQIVQRATCGRTLSASTARSGAQLTVTIALTAAGVPACLAVNGSTTYSALVHNVPPGTYDVRAGLRYVVAGSGNDSLVARASVTLP